MAVSKYNDPAYWRDRATEARDIPEGFASPDARKQMLEVAEGYGWIIEMAEPLKLMNGDKR